MGDHTGNKADPGSFAIIYYLREPCRLIAQVVTEQRENKAWASRVASQTFEVPNLKYKYPQDYQPFGGVVNPNLPGEPDEGWPLMTIEPPDSSGLAGFANEPYQARGGTPYSLASLTGQGGSGTLISGSNISLAGRVGPATCISGSGLGEVCESRADCGVGLEDGKQGQCVGMVKPESQTWEQMSEALRMSSLTKDNLAARAGQLFAKAYKVWQWQAVNDSSNKEGGHYELKCGGGLPENDQRYRDYCWDITSQDKNPPSVFNIRVNDPQAKKPVSDVYLRGEVVTIVLTFNSDVNPDHKPLVQYLVDWGDGSARVGEYNLKIEPRTDAGNPHLLTHTYICDNPAALPLCNGTTITTNCQTANGGCQFKPKIQVKDNWGWCNSNDGKGKYGDQCETDSGAWQEFPGSIIITTKELEVGRKTKGEVE
jgi:hypothetical protein